MMLDQFDIARERFYKEVEPTPKVASVAITSTRLPTWTDVWESQPPQWLILQEVGAAPGLQMKLTVSQPNDTFEQEADHVSDHVMGLSAHRSSVVSASPSYPGTGILPQLTASMPHLSHIPPLIQRATFGEGPGAAALTSKSSLPAETTMNGAAPTSEVTPAETSRETTLAGFLVEDSISQLGPGQEKKSDFLAQLCDAVCAASKQALAGTIWSASGCPWIARWFGYYSNRSSQQIESAIRRYAPEAANVASASDYIPIICERVRRAIAVWSTTSETKRVPPGVPTDLTEASAGESTGGTSATTSAGEAPSSETAVSLKGRDDGAKSASSPLAIQSQLGSGRSLDSSVKLCMESAFGMNFSHVCMHTDTKAEKLSNNLNPRAFTVGEHIAFGSGEYQPGTLVGDALIAHELAHVLQPRGAKQAQSAQESSASYKSLEEDADMLAVGAIASLRSGAKGILVSIAQNALPSLKSGLMLQRCSSSLLEKLQKIQDVRELHINLDSLKDEDLDKLQKNVPEGTLLSEGILWEKAFRKKDWTSLAKYSQTDKEGFFEAYTYQIVAQIMIGKTNIKVREESGFAKWVESQFIELVSKSAGFRLVIELLATGQIINITKTTGESTTVRIFSEQKPEAGHFITTDAVGEPFPLEQQRRGSPTGSNITLNPTLAENYVSLGKTDGNIGIIRMEPAVTFGHELIHALHNARGENIAPPPAAAILKALGSEAYLVSEAITGIATSAEELRTITGQTSFQAPSSVKRPINWALAYYIPSEGNITENLLRSERNLPVRVSHVGATRAFQVKVPTSETLDQMLSRYYMKDGRAVPDQIRIVLKEVFREFNPFFKGQNSVPPEMQKQLKEVLWGKTHEQYLALYLAYSKNQKDLADVALDLRLHEGS